MAEEVRFELTEPCGSSVFKTDAIDHSATLPEFQSAVIVTAKFDFFHGASPDVYKNSD